MTEFNFKPGDKIREPRRNPASFVHIVALGDDTFIGRVQTGECLYRKDGDWERYVEPTRKRFTIDTEYRDTRLNDDVILIRDDLPALHRVGGHVGPHWVVTKITEVVPPAVIPPSGAGASGIHWTAGGVDNGPGATT